MQRFTAPFLLQRHAKAWATESGGQTEGWFFNTCSAAGTIRPSFCATHAAPTVVISRWDLRLPCDDRYVTLDERHST
jgi:hypothetical protein